jgi:hypothetical protein
MNKDDAINKLKARIGQIREVKATAHFGAAFKKWQRDTCVALKKIFPDAPDYVTDFMKIKYEPVPGSAGTPDGDLARAYIFGLEHAEVFIESCTQEVQEYWDDSTSNTNRLPTEPYVDTARIQELSRITSDQYDLSKLLRLCNELSAAHEHGLNYSVIMLLRSILDHVPPIFGCSTFAQVASQIGGSSDKALLSRLEETSRKLADIHLHRQARKKEPALNPTQVNFKSELDFLLGEIVSTLHKN